MRQIIPLLILVSLAATAHARDTYSCRGGIISTQTSSVAELVKKCGQPTRIVQLENVVWAGAGERWDYFVGDKAVMFTVRAGKVARIDEA